jgi:hypothetical protein
MQAKHIDAKVVAKEHKKDFENSRINRFRYRRAILRIQASLDQRSSWLKITSGFGIYFILSTKKSPNLLKAWMGFIR